MYVEHSNEETGFTMEVWHCVHLVTIVRAFFQDMQLNHHCRQQSFTRRMLFVFQRHRQKSEKQQPKSGLFNDRFIANNNHQID